MSTEDRGHLVAVGVTILEAHASDFRLDDDAITFQFGESWRPFDSIYPALGSDIHSGLAADFGAKWTDEGCIKVDAHQRTSVPGLYAAGDVVVGLDQISHAMGEAGIAATTIRNDLAKISPLLR